MKKSIFSFVFAVCAISVHGQNDSLPSTQEALDFIIAVFNKHARVNDKFNKMEGCTLESSISMRTNIKQQLVMQMFTKTHKCEYGNVFYDTLLITMDLSRTNVAIENGFVKLKSDEEGPIVIRREYYDNYDKSKSKVTKKTFHNPDMSVLQYPKEFVLVGNFTERHAGVYPSLPSKKAGEYDDNKLAERFAQAINFVAEAQRRAMN